MRIKIYLILIALVTIGCGLFSACVLDTNCVKGSGTLDNEFRSLADFHSVDISNSCEFFFVQDTIQSLWLEAEDNILPLVLTRVKNGELKIFNIDCYRTTEPVQAFASMQEIRKFTISGSGDITAQKAFTVDNLDLIISGSGDIELELTANVINTQIPGSGDILLTGTADELQIKISGSGHIYANNLEVRECSIVITGSGNCQVFVTERLTVTISGSGDVFYHGNPGSIDSNITGSGEIHSQ